MDNTLSSKQKINLMRWTSLIKQREESGLNVTEWCRLNGIDRRTYYYWLEKLRNIAFELTDQELSQAIRHVFCKSIIPKVAHKNGDSCITIRYRVLHVKYQRNLRENKAFPIFRMLIWIWIL